MNGTTSNVDKPVLVGDTLTTAQYHGMAAAGILSCMLSLLGSFRVVMLIKQTRDQRHQKLNPYHRLMAGMALNDIMFSLGLFSNLFLVPSDIMVSPLAVGNTQTCSLAGYFAVWGATSASIYNCCLSMNYFLVLVRKWNNDQKEN